MWMRPAYRSLLLTGFTLALTGVGQQPALAQDQTAPQAAEVEVDNGILGALNPTPAADGTPSLPSVKLSRPGEKLRHATLTAPDVPPPGSVVLDNGESAPPVPVATPVAAAPPPVPATAPAAPAAVPAASPTRAPAPAPNATAIATAAVVAAAQKTPPPKPHTAIKKPILVRVPAPPPAHKPVYTPSGEQDAAGITHYPITMKTTSESIDPGIVPTAPAPNPDVAASLTAPPPVTIPAVAPLPGGMPPMPAKVETDLTANIPAPSAAVVNAIAGTPAVTPPPVQLPPANAANLPPLPKHRPVVQQASQSFVDQARKDMLLAEETEAIHRKYAFTTLSPAKPDPVLAEPLADAAIAPPAAGPRLGPVPANPAQEKMSAADRATLVQAIEKIHAATVKSGQPVPQIQTGQTTPAIVPAATATVITPAVMDLTAPVKTQAEKLSAPDLTAQIGRPEKPAASVPLKEGVPRPPPADAHGQDHFTVPFKAGAEKIDPDEIAVLEAHVLPQLKAHPSWRLQIQAFASSPDKEPVDARRISLSRALAIRSWLMDNGIEARRMDLRALGMENDKGPADRADIIFFDPEKG